MGCVSTNARRRETFCPTSVVLALGLALAWASVSPAQPPQDPPPALVRTTQVVEKNLSYNQGFVATAVPLRKSIVGSAVLGRVVEYLINEGDRVTKDQTLARLRTKTLEIELAAAQAQADLHRHELAELENGSRKEDIEAARSRMNAAAALEDYTKVQFTRRDALFKQGQTIAREERDESHSNYIQAQQAFLEAKAQYELVEKGPRKEKIDQAKDQLLVQQEEVRRLKDLITQHTIRSPLDGDVTAEHTEVGQWVSPGSPIAEIIVLDPIEILVHVPESLISGIRTGDKATVTFDALGGRSFEGRIASIVSQADLRSRTFPVKIRVANPSTNNSPLIKAGMLAKVRLSFGNSRLARLVPKDALVLGGPRPLVAIVDLDPTNPQQGIARLVPVERGIAEDDWIEVIGSVTKGQSVVIHGNERLRDGQSVILIP